MLLEENNSVKNLLLGGVGIVVLLASMVTVTYSLYATKLDLNEGELSNVVLAPPVIETEALMPEEKPQPKVQQNTTAKADTRKIVIQNISETPVIPKTISTTKNNVPERRVNTRTIVSDTDSNSGSGVVREGNDSGTGISNGQGNGTGTQVVDDPPPTPRPTPKPTPEPTVEKTPEPTPIPTPKKVVSGGVLNGQASLLVKPVYPPSAKAVNARGQVTVSVTISEDGNVISANATNGHVLLRQSAEQAAKASKFTPTFLSGQKVKVTGTIIYNFQ